MGWRIALLIAFCSIFMGNLAFAQNVEILPAGPRVIAEGCRFEAPTSSECSAPNGDVALIHFPEVLGGAVEEHVRAAKAAGYFDALSFNDFFHGHALLVTDRTEFATPEDFFSQIRAIVYHSAEYTDRWRAGDRRPRSFVGWTGGSHAVQPAIDLIPKAFRLRQYESSGTIYQDEVGKAHPGFSSLKYDNWGRAARLTIGLCSRDQCGCVLEDMVYILPRPDDRLDVYVRCAFAPPDRELAFETVKRPDAEIHTAAND